MSPLPSQASFRAKKMLVELVHSDMVGPISVLSLGGSRYFYTFIDDKSRFVTVRFVRLPVEVKEGTQKQKAIPVEETGNALQIFQTDNGTDLTEFLESDTVKRRLIVPHAQEQLGVAERMNYTLCDMARIMLADSGLPLEL